MINEKGYNLTEGGDANSERVRKKVYQYSLEGEYLQSFDSIADAASALNVNATEISKAANGRIHMSHNFLWSFEYKESIPAYQSRQKPVKQYTEDGQYIQTFSNLRQAALSLDKSTGSSNIQRAIKNNIKAYGFYWSY